MWTYRRRPLPSRRTTSGHLRVRLEADDAVHDVGARLLQLARPDDVVRLVEARLDLDQDHDLLAALGGGDERGDDRRVARGPVQGLLDREDVGVVRGLGDEPLHRRREGLVRVVDEDVAGADLGEDVDGLVLVRADEAERGHRDVGRRLQVGTVEGHQLPEGGEVQHPRHLEAVHVADADPLEEDLARDLGHRALHLEAHRLAEAPAPDLLLDREQQVVRLVLLDRDVGVAGDPEEVGLQDLHAPEQLVQVRLDHLVQEHELVALDREQARQDRRDLDPREAALAALGVPQADGDRERERADVRERVPGIHRERREHREDLVVEAAPERLVVLRDILVVEDLHALGGELPADRGPDGRVLCDELADARPDGIQLLGGRQAVQRLVLGARPGPGAGGRRRGPGRTRRGWTRRWRGT